MVAKGRFRRTKSAAQGRRLLAVAEIYDGGSRTKAACVGGVGLQTIRDWVLRFNAHGPEGLADRQAPGHPGKLNTAQREALAAMVESGLRGRRGVDHVGIVGRDLFVQPLRGMGEQAPMLVNRAPLCRHTVPDGGERYEEGRRLAVHRHALHRSAGCARCLTR